MGRAYGIIDRDDIIRGLKEFGRISLLSALLKSFDLGYFIHPS